MRDVASLLRAAAHPDRLRILQVLLDDLEGGGIGLPIGEIARRIEISRFSASHHLALLADARLVVCAIDGSRRLHSLCLEAFETIEDWVIAFTSADDA